jgi:hypothetical protein
MRATLGLALLLLTATGAQAQDTTVEVPFSRRIDVGAGVEIRLLNGMGDLDVVVGGAGVVTIDAEAGGTSTTDAQLIVQQDGGRLMVCVAPLGAECDEDGIRFRGRRRNRTSVDMRVTVPPGSELHASSGMGEVSVQGVRDPVFAASGNGDVVVTGAASEVEASSGNGSVRVSTTGGPVSASSGNGDIQVEMGAVPADARMSFNSGNGDIVLTLPATFAGEIDATFGNGDLESDFPITLSGGFSRNRVRGVIGSADASIRASSGNGDLVLRRR